MAFALAHEADDIGIAPMDPLWVFEGYTIDEPWVIVLAIAHNYDRLKEVPSDEMNGVGMTDVGEQYARGTRASYALANWIRSQGYTAHAFPGPMADALLLIPPADRVWPGGARQARLAHQPPFRIGSASGRCHDGHAADGDKPDRFGVDEFCASARSARATARRTPSSKRSRWSAAWNGGMWTSTNASRTSPRRRSCGICIAVCPWTRPTVRPNLLAKMARRLGDVR